MGIFDEHKQKKLQKARKKDILAESLWLWIGTVNLSRQAPRQMIGSQNLAKIPDWLLPRIHALADIQKSEIYHFKEDSSFEYKFEPSHSSFSQSFRCDIFKRVLHWKHIVKKLEKATK